MVTLEDSPQTSYTKTKNILTRKRQAVFRMFHSRNKCMQGRFQHATQSHADRSFEFPVTVGPPVRLLAMLHLTSMQQGCWGVSTVWKPELHHWCCCWCFGFFFMLVLMYLIIFTLLGTIYLNSSDRETSQVEMGNHLFRVKIHSLMHRNLIFSHIFYAYIQWKTQLHR